MKEKQYQDYRRLTQAQMPAIRRLVWQCCNYDHGDCIALDDGGGCCCVQAISYSLLCRWFREAVLPLDPPLELALLGGRPKVCASCGMRFVPGSNRARFCHACSVKQRKTKEAARQRNRYANLRI